MPTTNDTARVDALTGDQRGAYAAARRKFKKKKAVAAAKAIEDYVSIREAVVDGNLPYKALEEARDRMAAALEENSEP